MAYRRPKSLRDLLVHAKLKPDPKDNEPLGESKPCGRARCQTCKMILGTQTVKSLSGAVVKLKCDTNCKTANVVYLISCCKKGRYGAIHQTKIPFVALDPVRDTIMIRIFI